MMADRNKMKGLTLTLVYIYDKGRDKVRDMEIVVGNDKDCVTAARAILLNRTHVHDTMCIRFMEMPNATDIQPLRLNNNNYK